MGLLSKPLRLYDVADVERLCRKALIDAGARAKLTEADHDEWLADLIGLVWEKSISFDPERGYSFSKTSYMLCRGRVTDKVRKRNGYSRYGTAGDRLALSLDAPPAEGPRAPAWADQLVAPEPSGEGDDLEGLRAALRGLLEA